MRLLNVSSSSGYTSVDTSTAKIIYLFWTYGIVLPPRIILHDAFTLCSVNDLLICITVRVRECVTTCNIRRSSRSETLSLQLPSAPCGQTGDILLLLSPFNIFALLFYLRPSRNSCPQSKSKLTSSPLFTMVPTLCFSRKDFSHFHTSLTRVEVRLPTLRALTSGSMCILMETQK